MSWSLPTKQDYIYEAPTEDYSKLLTENIKSYKIESDNLTDNINTELKELWTLWSGLQRANKSELGRLSKVMLYY